MLKIISIEDSRADFSSIKHMLMSEIRHFEISNVTNLKDAKTILTSESFDCILLDLGLPDADNESMTLKFIQSVSNQTPIVVFSGNESHSIATQALQLGAQDYLIKGKANGYILNKTIHHAIERQKLLNELNKKVDEHYYNATHDFLTNLPNRSLFLEKAATLLSQNKRNEIPCAFVFVDLDNFKSINDNFGHNIGDFFLTETAHILNRGIRGGDICARISGDEFLIMLSPIDLYSTINKIVDRIGEKIKKIRHPNHMGASLSASFGVAFYPDHGNSLNELIELADQKMYDTKHQKKMAEAHQ